MHPVIAMEDSALWDCGSAKRDHLASFCSQKSACIETIIANIQAECISFMVSYGLTCQRIHLVKLLEFSEAGLTDSVCIH